MIKKLIFSLAVLTIGMGGLMMPYSSYASVHVNLNEDVSYVEKLLVCCELADQKVLSQELALRYLRTGQLTITKIDSGVYHVVYPGGISIVELETSNF